MIAELRADFNRRFTPETYERFLLELDRRCETHVEFRVAETPVFVSKALLDEIGAAGAAMARTLIAWPEYLQSANRSIPNDYRVSCQSAHPHFLTADFALISEPECRGTAPSTVSGKLVPRLVEIQAFPSVFSYQAELNHAYSEFFGLPEDLGVYLGDLSEEEFWTLMRKTILGSHAPEHVVLTEVDPLHQKTLPDFLLTARRLGIQVIDITLLVPVGNKLHYRNVRGELIPIHRIYNRAIADEMIARKISLPFRLSDEWDVEWAGHPNWYFLISKYSVPWLSRLQDGDRGVSSYVPPAVFLDEFLDGCGFEQLAQAGVDLPSEKKTGSTVIYENLLLKPLFSFAGKGIQFAPSRAELLAIPEAERKNYLLQQRMQFVPTIETPCGLTQAEIRILYLWPDGGELTPAISLVRLGRGKMMGVDHNRNQEWVGGSAAFWRS